MARYFKHLLPLISYLLFLTACQEGRDAGDLFGQWRKGDSSTEYMSFSGPVAVFRSSKDMGRQVFGNYQRQGDSLFIQCFSKKGAVEDTIIVEKWFGLRPLNDIRLKVESLADDQLIVSKDGQIWNYYKY